MDIFYVHLEYLKDIWDILWPFGAFCVHLVHFVCILYIFPRFGIMEQEKSGNPAQNNKKLMSSAGVVHYVGKVSRISNHGPRQKPRLWGK
jgi:hypothetical protein